MVVRDLDAIYADRVRPGVSVMSAGRMAAAARKAWRRIRQRQTPARMTARPGKIAVSCRWRGQKRLAGW